MKKLLLYIAAFNVILSSAFAGDRATLTDPNDEALRISDEAMKLYRESNQLAREGEASLARTKYAEAMRNATTIINISISLSFDTLQSCATTLEALRASDDENRHGLDYCLADIYNRLVNHVGTPESLKPMYKKKFNGYVANMSSAG